MVELSLRVMVSGLQNHRLCKLTTEHKDIWPRHVLTTVAAKYIRQKQKKNKIAVYC